MLAGKRAVRVGDKVGKEVAVILLERVRDPRIRDVTITGSRLSDDLKQARIYFSVLGGELDVERAQAGLKSARSFIKKEIGRRMSLRYVPEIKFVYDSSLERGNHFERLFARLESNKS
ncbi:MAG: ribosome-binding factor A [Desulfobacteraceae bacterium 4484_190.1]|nr:30S ribosome-binding factor RbfA [Deltaproteobacteria bacterium]OPX39854.1 MAG: ribosome-binding factor A [Desulfobacteraceae bacterium 4484_190.1]